MGRLGRTNLELFPLGLGGIPLMRLDADKARRVIDTCLEGGINFADSAEGYGDSEEKLAGALTGDRESFFIATKSIKRSAAGMAKAIDQSLKRLSTSYIDIYQIHALGSLDELERILSPGGALEALSAARASGKVRFIGVTGHQPAVLAEALKTGEFDTVMAPINVVDRESEEVLLPLARDLDIGIMAMKPVCGGTLDNPVQGLRWCLNSGADVVLCGMKGVDEVLSNLDTVKDFKPLTPDEAEELLAAASQMGNQFCRRCGYCQPCPQGINIPRILWLANVHRRASAGDTDWTEEEYALMAETADYCQECGECEEICPYELPTREMLKHAHLELRPTRGTRLKRRVKRAVDRARRFSGHSG
jgi:hypothetical protein